MRRHVYIFTITIFVSILSLFTPALADSSGTRVNCEAYRTSFGENLVLASSGTALFKLTATGWLRLPAPDQWEQVRVAGNDTIYLFSDETNAIYRSTDGGLNWAHIANTPFPDSDIVELYVPPTNGMLFLSLHSASGSPSNRGVWRSIDDGVTWQHVFDTGHALTTLSPLVFSPAFAQDGTMFAAETGRGTFVGIWKSVDFGQNWATANDGLQVPAQYGNRAWLTVSPQFAQDHVLFSSGGPLDWGFYKTVDAGATWDYIDALRPTSVALSPAYATDQTVLIADPETGVYGSHDGGGSIHKAWDQTGALVVGVRPARIASVTIKATRAVTPTLEFWAVVQGVQPGVCYLYRSCDKGETWKPQKLFETPYAFYLPLISR
jgi:photosystem II stability/assembly factor-like uncharacterized protein